VRIQKRRWKEMDNMRIRKHKRDTGDEGIIGGRGEGDKEEQLMEDRRIIRKRRCKEITGVEKDE
jgi:hypothetical protein